MYGHEGEIEEKPSQCNEIELIGYLCLVLRDTSFPFSSANNQPEEYTVAA